MEASLHDRPQGAELRRVGEQERLVQALGQLGMGVELAVGGGDVAVFEQVGEAPPAGRHGELELVGLERQRPALRRVGEALLEVVRPPLGVPSAVDGQRQRRLIAQPPGHRHGFLAQLEAATVEIRPVEGHRQPAPAGARAISESPGGMAAIASSRRATSVSSRRPLKW